MPGRRIDNREFVVTWLNSTSIQDVAKGMNISVPGVRNKAQTLKKLGVKLPPLVRTKTDRDLEIAQLNSLINKHMAARKSA